MPRTKAFKEEDVLDRAMGLFWEKGFHATSMQNLVDHLGINRASLYATFGGKEELFDKAFARYRAGSEKTIRQVLESAGNLKDGLEKLFLHSVSEAMEGGECRGCMVVNTTTELLPGNAKMLDILAGNRVHFTRFFQDLLQQARERGELPPGKNPESLAIFLFTFYNGLQVIAKTDPSPESLREAIGAGLSVLD